jgi:hypothetical protein
MKTVARQSGMRGEGMRYPSMIPVMVKPPSAA